MIVFFFVEDVDIHWICELFSSYPLISPNSYSHHILLPPKQAARMAIEIGLNTYTPYPAQDEPTHARLERRNRERTYLVLWVHDRSLSMQTGRMWMLPEVSLIVLVLVWFFVDRKADGSDVFSFLFFVSHSNRIIYQLKFA